MAPQNTLKAQQRQARAPQYFVAEVLRECLRSYFTTAWEAFRVMQRCLPIPSETLSSRVRVRARVTELVEPVLVL